jgi:hypothetical protein
MKKWRRSERMRGEEKSFTCEFLGGDEILAKGLDEVPDHTAVPSVESWSGCGQRREKEE